MTQTSVQPETINRLRNGVELSFAMLAGMQLDLFSALQDGPRTLEQIAKERNVRPIKLRPLIYALVVSGLLEVNGEQFSNTAEADRFLVKGKSSYLGAIAGSLSFRWGALLGTGESIRSAIPQSKLDFSEGHEQELEKFLRGIQSETVASGFELIQKRDFQSCQTLADVGGGSGGLAIAVTESCPQVDATVIDLPTVAPIAEKIISEAGASERVKVLPADAVSGPIPGRYDVAVLRALIQVLSPEDAVRVLKNVYSAVKPGGRTHIIGRTLDDTRLTPLSSVGFSLLTLNLYENGQAYTKREHQDWLAEAGFEGFELTPLGAGFDLMTANKPA